MHTFQNGLPALGLGLWKLPQDKTANLVEQAVQIGYRHFDGACDYGNERHTGDGLRAAMNQGLCQREDLWLTSKLWNTYHRPEHVLPALEKTLDDFQTDYLDLYMMHFPISLAYVPFETRYPPEWIYDPSADQPEMKIDPVPLHETWMAMEALVKSGKVKHIGVCNFNTGLFNDLLAYSTIKPSVLQIESHPFLTQEPLLRRCQEENVTLTAFSPLGASSYVELDMAEESDVLLQHPVIRAIAEEHRKTPAQVLLRWGIQRDTAVVCKSTQPQRLAENFAVFDFELSHQAMQDISGLNQDKRYNDPEVFCEQAFGRYYPIYD